MPVTKTAKRALRGSRRKQSVNKRITDRLEAAFRIAKKNKRQADIRLATSLADRAVKKKVIHKRKASHIKKVLSKFLPTTAITKKVAKKKTTKTSKISKRK